MKILFCRWYKIILDSGGGATIDKDLSSEPLIGYACLDKLVQLRWRESSYLLRLVEPGEEVGVEEVVFAHAILPRTAPAVEGEAEALPPG